MKNSADKTGSETIRRRVFCTMGAILALNWGLHCVDAQVIVADSYEAGGTGNGFTAGQGVNSGISPPQTRLIGLAAQNLRYVYTGTKSESAFGIIGGKLQVTAASNSGRFTLSDGIAPWFDFSQSLGSTAATPAKPAVYTLKIKMANRSAGLQRFSFAIATENGDATQWDFGVQLYRNTPTDNYYTIGKRIDSASCGGADINSFITNTVAGSFGTEIGLMLRVTDAGVQSEGFNSRLQLSMDDGLSWFYDTLSDPDLPQGWRFDAPGRCVVFDVAPGAGVVTYDAFSMESVHPLVVARMFPKEDSANLGASPTLHVAVSNSIPLSHKVTFYGRIAGNPYPGPDFCMAVLPDTQNYAREAAGNGDAVKEMWFAQTDWIVTNRVQNNIAYVAHLGDVVQNGDVKDGNPNTMEWRNATNAMYRLENPARTLLRDGIPYGIAVGNHDQEPIDDPDGTTTHYNQYFGISRFQGRSYYGGNYPSNNDSHFDLFSASGLDFIVLYFENDRYGSGIIGWAQAVLSTNKNRRVIAVMHNAGGVGTPANHSAQAAAIYQGLKGNPNFFMMLGGHVVGEGSRTDTYNGRTVHTFISDYQGRTNGGEGWMRLIYFSPSNNLVRIKTYSPWLNRYERDANSEMSFNFNLQLPSGPGSPETPFKPLGTNCGVQSGESIRHVWRGLAPNTKHEWRIQVEDEEGHSVWSPVWSFTTGNNWAPVATNIFVSVVGDQPATLQFFAEDGNDDVLSFQTYSLPSNGSTEGADNGAELITYRPAHGFRGADLFYWRATDGLAWSPLAMFTVNVLSPPDTNSNGLPDYWEERFSIVNPDGDDDADGMSNLLEYKANTDPSNPDSMLRVVRADRQEDGRFSMTWSSVGGTRYRVQCSEGPLNGSLFSDIARPLSEELDRSSYGSNSMQSYTNALASNTNRALFYKVRVVE